MPEFVALSRLKATSYLLEAVFNRWIFLSHILLTILILFFDFCSLFCSYIDLKCFPFIIGEQEVLFG